MIDWTDCTTQSPGTVKPGDPIGIWYQTETGIAVAVATVIATNYKGVRVRERMALVHWDRTMLAEQASRQRQRVEERMRKLAEERERGILRRAREAECHYLAAEIEQFRGVGETSVLRKDDDAADAFVVAQLDVETARLLLQALEARPCAG